MEWCWHWQGLVEAQLDMLHQAWDAAGAVYPLCAQVSLLPYLAIEAALSCSSSHSLQGCKELRVPVHPPRHRLPQPRASHRAQDG